MFARKKVNKDFFKKWSPEMAYVCGFFSADGYMTINRRGGQYWSLDIGDKFLINKIKKIIGSNHKIGIRSRGGGKYITYRLQVGSIEMCEDLRVLGYDERKTKRLCLPNIPQKYFSDFVRGYFDGDGNVWSGIAHKNNNKNTRSIQTVFTSCSRDFLDRINNSLCSAGIENGVLRRGCGDYYRLTYSINGSLKLYKFMYNGLDTSGLFLKRKKGVFEKYIKMRL